MSDSDQQHSKAAFPLIQPGTGTFIKKFTLAEGSSALVIAEPTSLGAMNYRFVMAVSVGKKPRLFITLETNRLTSMPAFSDLMRKHGLAESDLNTGPFLVIYADGMTTNIRQAPDLLTPDAFIVAATEEALKRLDRPRTAPQPQTIHQSNNSKPNNSNAWFGKAIVIGLLSAIVVLVAVNTRYEYKRDGFADLRYDKWTGKREMYNPLKKVWEE